MQKQRPRFRLFVKASVLFLLTLGVLAIYLSYSYFKLPEWKRIQYQGDIQQWETGIGGAFTSLISDSMLAVRRLLTNEQYTLTVVVQPPEVVKSIRVYVGSSEGPLGDERYGQDPFPRAELVSEKTMHPSGRVSFTLEPGKYFIYPVIDYDEPLARKAGIVPFYGAPREVLLDGDMEISPRFISH